MTTLQISDERTREDGKLRLVYEPINRLLSVKGELDDVSDYDSSCLNFPVRVVAEITSRCNMRCDYCSQGNNPEGKSLDLGDILRIIDEVDAFYAFELSIRGAEALLHPNFDDIWSYAVGKEFVSTNLITNGTLLDEEKVLSMLQNPRSKIIVSLDGPKEINARFRSTYQYEKVMKWLIPILRQKRDQIVVLTTVYRQNYEQIPEFATHLSGLRLRHYHLSLLKQLGDLRQGGIEQIKLNEMYQLEEGMDTIVKTNPSFKPVISSPFFNEKRDMLTGISISLFTEYYCGSGMKILSDGRIGISQIIYFDDVSQNKFTRKNQIRRNCLGKIDDGKSLRDIWVDSKKIRIKQTKMAQEIYPFFLGIETPIAQ